MAAIDDVFAALTDLRARRPLVHNITNYVAMSVSANVLLALGASPAMVHALEEVEDFVAISDALAVNIGTLSPPWVEAMQKAVARANMLGKPWVLDPVGSGATPYRTRAAVELAALKPRSFAPTPVKSSASLEKLAAAKALIPPPRPTMPSPPPRRWRKERVPSSRLPARSTTSAMVPPPSRSRPATR